MKISPVVKNNKTLIIVLAVTFVCACVMIFECLSVYGDIQEIMEKIVEDDAEIQRINGGKNPNPVKSSEKIIQANTEQYRLRIRDIRRRIGNPYREALKDFLRNLESAAFLKDAPLPPAEFVDARGPASSDKPAPEARPAAEAAPSDKPPVTLRFTEDEIRAAFVDLYNEYYSDRKNADTQSSNDNELLEKEHNEIFEKFREKLIQPPEKMEFSNDDERKAYLAAARLTFDKAFYHFRLQIQKNTIEPIDSQDAKFIFLDALGLPRIMTSFHCKVFVDEVSTYIKKNPSVIPGLALWAKNPGSGNEGTSAGGIEARIQSFTFNHKNMMPPPGNVVHILRHYRILEDLFRRMNESHIQVLTNVASPFSEKPTGDLSGDTYREMGSDYKKFAYEVTVISTGGEIRDFINQLHHAFEQNIIYDIREISFLKTPQLDEVKSAAEKVDALRKSGGGADAQPRNDGEAAQPGAGPTRTPEDIYSDPEYGTVLIGQKELVQAVIKFNYILYVGEMLGKKKD